MKVIVWSQENGIVAVTTPVIPEAIDEVQLMVTPEGVTSYQVDIDDLPMHPSDPAFDAVRMDKAGVLSVDAAAKKLIEGRVAK